MNGSLKRQICALVFCLLLVRIYPASADLIINEIMYDPSIVSDTSGEWFEVFNSGAALDLQGYFIDDGGASKIITAPLAIGSGGYLVFGRNNDLSSNGGVPVDYTVSFSLGNSGDTLSILDPDGVPINSVTYGPGTGFPSTVFQSTVSHTDPVQGSPQIPAHPSALPVSEITMMGPIGSAPETSE